jgi:hypothetical protein
MVEQCFQHREIIAFASDDESCHRCGDYTSNTARKKSVATANVNGEQQPGIGIAADPKWIFAGHREVQSRKEQGKSTEVQECSRKSALGVTHCYHRGLLPIS